MTTLSSVWPTIPPGSHRSSGPAGLGRSQSPWRQRRARDRVGDVPVVARLAGVPLRGGMRLLRLLVMRGDNEQRGVVAKRVRGGRYDRVLYAAHRGRGRAGAQLREDRAPAVLSDAPAVGGATSGDPIRIEQEAVPRRHRRGEDRKRALRKT